MKKEQLVSKEPQRFWISITGYRILIILKALIEKSCTIEELIKTVQDDKYINKSISKDTIRIAINTLKSAGCIFERPSKANGYKYRLLKHPFGLNLNNDEFKIFIALREDILPNLNWQEVNAINSLYEKIALLTFNNNQIELVEESKPFKNINSQIISNFFNPNLKGRKVNIKYMSPEFGKEDIDIVPQKIKYDNNKLYLECFSCKYNSYTLLSVERILQINHISMTPETKNISNIYNVIYEVWGNSFITFEKKENEEIISNNHKKLRIKAKVDNEFLFIQRLLLFGSDFKIIEPFFFKEKLIDKIKLIKKGYNV